MGLDTTHNAWHGPYSAFANFREWIANEIGISLDYYIGYNIDGTKDLSSIEHPIMPLLNHSDCDGILTVDEQKSIVKGLEMILENVKVKNDYLEKKAINFIEGCREAISKNEPIIFG